MNLKLHWEPEIKQVLNEIQNNDYHHPVAVFDFDNTLIYGDQGTNLMNYLISNLYIKGNEDWFWHPDLWYNTEINTIRQIKMIFEKAIQEKDNYKWRVQLLSNLYKVFHELERIDLEIAYRWTKIFFAGFSIEELKELSKVSFELALKQEFKDISLDDGIIIQQGIRINPLLMELVNTLRQKNWDIYIITAAPEIAIQAVSFYWNINEDHVLGMKLKQKNNILLPEIIEPYTYNEGKYLNIKNVVDAPILLAVGDSYPDIELLSKAKTPIFLKRKGKDELVEIARKKNFYIQQVEDV